MNILVLYALSQRKTRKTILDSFYCFSKYDQKNNYYFLNIIDIDSVKKVYKMGFHKSIKLSAIIVHYSAIAQRFDRLWWNYYKSLLIDMLKQYDCTKIIIPQDEYNCTYYTQEFIRASGIKHIYTCAFEDDYEKLYPKDLNYIKIETVFTGYIDEDTLNKIHKLGYDRERNIDIGYRARKGAYWLGRHGQLKSQLVEVFLNYLKDQSGIIYDIANTKEDNSNVFLGDAWIEYLLKCRTVLGCLGGSSILDENGSITKKVDKYCFKNPDASFEQVEEICFKGKDDSIHLFALSPRHFESAMTKTCQVLIEGNYMGVMEPNIDYIEIKKDFSNIDEVVSKIRDVDYCKSIAENCYTHVVLSGKYTYAKFVERIIGDIEHKGNDKFNLNLWIICKASKYFAILKNPIYRIPIQEITISKHKLLSIPFINIFIKCALKIQTKIQTCSSIILGKIFKYFEPFKDTKWHKFLKRKWDERSK